ncbi:Spy/CpxP family protein refolding chaperone [Draconibacterium halophilum]|uniref:Periplasmic heavy metal sensor n=1 Tax=Draconibacterium halophilum TaxID=2706887 RepID=A0A6C0RC84_9BACT|nr:periplasmic heavy metal sensor [Draconibacterium halophilum]QIA06731.1 periplasmic heavy metal sensor [Draconibacterium halophilum]
MKTKILSLALIVVFAFSITTMAQQPERKRRSPEQREMTAKRFDRERANFKDFFTEEQQEKMKELRLKSTKAIQPLRNELNELRAKQRTLTTAEKADMKAIEDNIEKMAAIQVDIQKIRAKQHQEIRSMLSEEQRIKFDEMKSRRDKGFDRNPTPRNRFRHGA